jgi:DNA-binding protein H-NS
VSGQTDAASGSTNGLATGDPETGIEWSGWGREPFWIKGKDRKQFEIEDA